MPPFTPDFEGATDTCNFDVVEDGLTAMVSGGGVGTCDPCSIKFGQCPPPGGLTSSLPLNCSVPVQGWEPSGGLDSQSNGGHRLVPRR